MNNNYFFSVIVPCWNCNETIERLLNSLVNQQDTAKEEFEVILCDDGHEDNWVAKINKYKDLLNIIYVQTKEHKIHCPGNTRLDALSYARGEWITFIDNDDFLVTDALNIAKKNILENNLKYVLAAKVVETDLDNNLNSKCYERSLTLLHGKFYNKEFLNKYNITFKENFYTHEDLYFNNTVMAALYKEGQEDLFWVNNILYIWVINSKSVSRSYVQKPKDKNYLETHFLDYLKALSDPLLNVLHINKEIDEKIYFTLINSIIYGYFYYQGELYYLKEKSASELQILIKYIKTIMEKCEITRDRLIELCYRNPFVFNAVREEIPRTEGYFIEEQSLKDFILTNIAEDQSNNS